MNHRPIFAVMLLAAVSLACSLSIPLPQVPTPGPEQTDQVAVSYPASGETSLTISFGAGELDLAPGAKQLVEGTATYNIPDLKPEVLTQGSSVELKQGNLKSLTYPSGIVNNWDLKLGTQPMALAVNGGAYSGTYELGGLALTSLTVKDGAANVHLAFSQPNPSQMTLFRYETGASNVKLTKLANANFSTMVFNSGGGDYTLDFSGTLKRDATVTISSGVSNLILVVPDTVPANVTVESGVSNVNAGSEWTQHGNIYSQTGTGPALTFVIKTGAGNLTLTH
jgi:hypothetical protein